MNPTAQESAAAASDAYNDRPKSQIDSEKRVFLDGHEYRVFDYKDDPSTGFHATAYKEVAPPHNVIIAYRGTDPDIKEHTRTTVQDAIVDYMMVMDRVNPQEAAARAFTQEVLKKAHENGISKDLVTVAGHSLGGALAEIEAARFGLRGATFNAYGAVDLGYGVPEGGHQVTNYVMAGDVVSAASHHFGEVKVLASDDDIQSMKAGRYLDAPPGSPSPNPLLAMSLGDHSITNFVSTPGKVNVLAPTNMPEYEVRYQNNKAAIDHYRDDVYTDRAELVVALRNPDSRNIAITLANLSPRLQQQLLEFHAATVDAPIQHAVEHNLVVEGAKQELDQTAASLRTGGDFVQQSAEHVSQGARAAGQTMQRQTDEVARTGLGFATIDPLAAASMVLGAKAVGYTAGVQAEGVAQASHLVGQATHATTQFAAEQAQLAKYVVEQGAHAAAQSVKDVVHVHEVAAVVVAGGVIDGYQHVKAGAETIRATAHETYRATEHAASQTYDTLTHPGQWIGHPPTPSHASSATAPMHSQVQAITPIGSTHAPNDPRHPDNLDHALYNELQRRIPNASENRLLQFTATCHTNKITADNLSTIHLNEERMTIGFCGSSFLSTPGIVDLNIPAPQPQQAIQHIQQYDQQQAQMMGEIRAQNAQINQQGRTQ